MTTDDFTASVREFAAKQLSKSEQARAQNRARHPDIAAFVDQMRAVFGKVKVIRITEDPK